MEPTSFPIVDIHNPFYCPSVPAQIFLESVRERLKQSGRTTVGNSILEGTPDLTRTSFEDHFPSFVELLDQSLCDEDLLELLYEPDDHHLTSATGFRHSSFLSTCLAKNWGSLTDGSNSDLPFDRDPLQSSRNSTAASHGFSAFAVPAKRERSFVDVNDSSFELSAKADKLHLFPQDTWSSSDGVTGCMARTSRPNKSLKSVEELMARIHALEDELFGRPIGTESPAGISALVSRLSRTLPGIRLEEKLLAAGASSHQEIANVLAADGNLSCRILHILRTSEIAYLDLSSSIGDEEGLNLDSKDIFRVFSKANSFVFLAEINLNNAELRERESDLIHLHGLPRLARLGIANTDISNEAIYYLTPLKRSLTELNISHNPRVDDDAIPAILILTKLLYLAFEVTSISVVGIRRLAKTLHAQKRTMDVEVPRECEIYVSKIADKHLLKPEAPLVTALASASSLTTAELLRNIAAHSRSDVKEREILVTHLQNLLEIREADLLAGALVCQEPFSED